MDDSSKDSDGTENDSRGNSEQNRDIEVDLEEFAIKIEEEELPSGPSFDLTVDSDPEIFVESPETWKRSVKLASPETKENSTLAISEESYDVLVDGLPHKMEFVQPPGKQSMGIKFTLIEGPETFSQTYPSTELVSVCKDSRHPPVKIRNGFIVPKHTNISHKDRIKVIKRVGISSPESGNGGSLTLDHSESRNDENRKWLHLYFIKRRRSCHADGVWRVKLVSAEFESREKAEKWLENWETWIEFATQNNLFPLRPKHLLVFVNPFGGTRKAPQIFEKRAKPVYDLAGIKLTVVETKAQSHALETVRDTEEFEQYDGIVSVGGDGLFNEILCGLVVREQRSKRIDYDNLSITLARPKVRVGIVPAGSTNALACTIMGNEDPVTAALHIALGDESGVDVCAVYHNDKLIRFASTMVSFGYLGDVLKDSETKRALGPIRYRISGSKMLLKNPAYFGRVAFKPVFDDARPDLEQMNLAYRSKQPLRCHAECDVCFRIRSGSLKCGEVLDTEQMYTNHVTDHGFNHVVAVITPCLSRLSPDGLSPMSHLGDGTLDLGLVAGISRCQNAKFMVEAMSKGANHVKRSFVHMFRVNRFSYTPGMDLDIDDNDNQRGNLDEEISPRALNIRGTLKLCKKSRNGSSVDLTGSSQQLRRRGNNEEFRGIWNVDGEVFKQPEGTLHFRVHRQLIKLFARGIELNQDRSDSAVGCTGSSCCSTKRHSSAVSTRDQQGGSNFGSVF